MKGEDKREYLCTLSVSKILIHNTTNHLAIQIQFLNFSLTELALNCGQKKVSDQTLYNIQSIDF